MKIVLLMLSLTAFRSSMILGTPMDRHIGKYLGFPVAHGASASVPSEPAKLVADDKDKKKEEPQQQQELVWLPESELELKKVPWFVRGIVRRRLKSTRPKRVSKRSA